ncbi:Cytochrome c oxidase subunit 4 [Mycoemilia scoparia]|uniref:Cytochrome c oxidase subunit 4 n=1 Tax=Mycoemilia scoparia TaxID=417184 RepID=A0A9W8A116_9FUNG|nr:Cytochrome c oxidase subunit 4 [Mycoemilia scoparia]
MFKSFARSLTKTNTLALTSRVALRRFSVATMRLDSNSTVEKQEGLFGPGVPKDRVGTAFDQSTGLERAQLLKALEGKELFDMGPLHINAKGTKQAPIIVESNFNQRLVGCQGHPEEEHEIVWIQVEREHGIDRCPECGNVFKLSEPSTN